MVNSKFTRKFSSSEYPIRGPIETEGSEGHLGLGMWFSNMTYNRITWGTSEKFRCLGSDSLGLGMVPGTGIFLKFPY